MVVHGEKVFFERIGNLFYLPVEILQPPSSLATAQLMPSQSSLGQELTALMPCQAVPQTWTVVEWNCADGRDAGPSLATAFERLGQGAVRLAEK